jgi:hypothetical protein
VSGAKKDQGQPNDVPEKLDQRPKATSPWRTDTPTKDRTERVKEKTRGPGP